jgi:hypothetical protein
VINQGYSINETYQAVGVSESAMRRWVKQLKEEQHLQLGKEAKAKRGELFSTVAPGYIRDDKSIVKDPNIRVQEAIILVFKKFQELGSMRQVHTWFFENKLELPTNKSWEGAFQLIWKLPALTFIPGILHNPLYAGPMFTVVAQSKKCLKTEKFEKVRRVSNPLNKRKSLLKTTMRVILAGRLICGINE